jgi:hypothetical protein
MKPWHAPIVALCALFLIGNIGTAFAQVAGFPLGGGFMTLYAIGSAWAVAWWIVIDCRRHRVEVSIDHGFFALYAWPIMLPLHLWRTRGPRGFLLLAGLLGLYLATWLIALLFYLLA